MSATITPSRYLKENLRGMWVDGSKTLAPRSLISLRCILESRVEIMETFTFTQEVKLADADGMAISEGSVLLNIKDGERGVVVKVGRAGTVTNIPMFSVGDIAINKSAGVTRVTNKYSEWRHVPKKDQTYNERLLSWLQKPYEHDEYQSVSRDEGCAINGIMAILPDEIIDWDYGPFPDRIEDALRFLVEHLEEKTNQLTK